MPVIKQLPMAINLIAGRAQLINIFVAISLHCVMFEVKIQSGYQREADFDNSDRPWHYKHFLFRFKT
jgi:hypothetical protein